MAQLLGVDVSNWQRHPDFGLVRRAGYSFALIKTSEDDWGLDDYYDPYAAGNWANAAKAGLVRGVYHFARPSKSTPAESVAVLQRAVAAIGGFTAGDLYALDIEDEQYQGSLHAWVVEWLDRAESTFGFPGFKYSGAWYTSTRDLEHPDLETWPTWWASYQERKPAPVTGWGPIRLWQHAADGRVPGVSGDCDLNLFDGSRDDLLALGKPASTEPPPYDVGAARDRLWKEADALEANGWPWFGQGVKALVSLSKQEK